MKKIAFFSVFPLEYGGGLEKYYIDISSNILSRYEDQVKQISIINMSDVFYGKMCMIFGLRPIYRNSPSEIEDQLGGVFWTKEKYNKLQKTLNQFDVIYTKNEILELSVLKTIKLKKEIKLIAGVHTSPQYPNTSTKNKIRNFLYSSLFYDFLVRRVDVFHTINRDNTSYLQKRYPTKYVRRINNPFNFHNFNALGSKITQDFEIDKTKNNIIWIGRLSKEKGIDDLISIIKKSNKEKTVFYILGNGELRGKLLESLKNIKNFNFLGHVENNKLPGILKKMNLFITTSKREGFPYNVLEAQAMGLCAISYDIPGCNDIIDHGKNGFLVGDLDSFIQILKDIDGGRVHVPKKNRVKKYIKHKFDFDAIYKQLFLLLNN